MKAASSPPRLRRYALEEVRSVYKELTAIPVQRDCRRLTECCHFRLTGRTPQLTAGEAVLAAQALRASGRKELPPARDGACPLLSASGSCLIYQNRPFGCRTHYCSAAGGPYERGEVIHLIRRLENLDVALGGDGPRPLQGAIETALRLK